MPDRRKIIILGGLLHDVDRGELLDRLVSGSNDNVIWEWIKADGKNGYRVAEKYFKKMLYGYRQTVKVSQVDVVKLHCLHNSQQNILHKNVPNLVQVPLDIETVDQLIKWLLSSEAGLIPRAEWQSGVGEAALAAILAKLIRNKAWNNSLQGHEWVKEADLLGQSPVNRKGHDKILAKARVLLRKGERSLFLSKGGNQGQTPKEWCINQSYLPAVKQSIMARNFGVLLKDQNLNSIYSELQQDSEGSYRIDGEIVNERVNYECRARK